MTADPYAVEFTATADLETRPPFPERAFAALYDVLVTISRDPWGQTRPNATEPSEAFRWAPFGEAGWVYVHVDDQRRTVRVYQVTWLG